MAVVIIFYLFDRHNKDRRDRDDKFKGSLSEGLRQDKSSSEEEYVASFY